MILLCIDPGAVRTGVALMYVFRDGAPQVLETWLVPGGPDGFLEWWKTHPAYDVLVCEDYIVRQGVHTSHAAQRTVGFLRGQDNVVLQAPAGRKTLVSDAVLKRLGLYHTQRDIKEALRHGVLYLRSIRHTVTLKHGWG